MLKITITTIIVAVAIVLFILYVARITVNELETHNDNLGDELDDAERKAAHYARGIKAIEDEVSTNQYGSVENLQNKIKSILDGIANTI